MTLFENAYEEVSELVRKFDEHKDQFLAPKYQEAHVRAEFLDKFWTALGWDVRHEFQTNPREQEVKIEKSDNVSMRKADYAFYLKPEYQRPVFLVEAKKPSQDIEKPEYYFQTARYGFNTGTSVAVLTDFQEFHIIDCRRKPELVAGIVNATQLFKFSYKDYLDRDKFGEIYWKFSREAVAEGKLKEYWRSLKKPKGAVKQLKLIGDQLQAPDDLFLDDLEGYRRTLASEFKKSNENMTSEDLTQAAQKVLDRLVFIRFLEDKMIEPDAIIDKFTSASKTPSWKTFIVQSQKLDKTYNGVVFKEHFIDRSSFNAPKDEKFAAIADELSHHRSPYLFSYIPVEILGSIYERFLGKVVVAKGRGISVEEKPEVRKAGGVYYTPKYIVDYIVSNTVGRILSGDREPGSGDRRNLKGEKNDTELSGFTGVADGDGYDGRSFRSAGPAANERTLRTEEPNESSGDIGTEQYSRRVGKEAHEGIHSSSLDSIRVADGNRNANDDSDPKEVSDTGANGKILGVQFKDGPNAQSPNAVSGAGTGFRGSGSEKLISLSQDPGPQNPLPSRIPDPGSRNPLTPKEISKLRFADIACGSGSFLIAIFDAINNYLEKWYTDHPDEAVSAGCREMQTDDNGRLQFGLSLEQKRNILQSNIFGVDIDSQAVEVAQFSLFLKLLESETIASVQGFISTAATGKKVSSKQLTFHHGVDRKVLPDLSKNIQCGNSLVEYDISDLFPLTPQEEMKIKPFSFTQAFKPIMDAGGFDAIVGNPPYIKVQMLQDTDPAQVAYLKKKYFSAQYGNFDLYVVFIDRALSLLSNDGIFGYIVSNKFLNSNYGKNLREIIAKGKHVRELIHFGDYQVFDSASTYTCILLLSKKANEIILAAKIDRDNFEPSKLDYVERHEIKADAWSNGDWNILTNSDGEVLAKLMQNTHLEKLTTNIFQGPKAGCDNAFIFKLVNTKGQVATCYSEILAHDFQIEASILKKYVKSKYMKSYFIDFSAKEVTLYPYTAEGRLLPISEIKEEYPLAYAYLNIKEIKSALQAREEGRFNATFWQYSRPQNMAILQKEKILTPFNAFHNSFCLDTYNDFIFSAGVTGAYGILLKEEVDLSYKTLLAILNSKVTEFVIRRISTSLRGGYFSYENKYLRQLPIPNIGSATDQTIQRLVDQMVDTKKQIAASQRDSEREQLHRKCDYLDGEIDKLVYALYGLTEVEIRIVEGSV